MPGLPACLPALPYWLQVLGKPLDKSQQVSDWGRRPLSSQQLEYAALDAHAAVLIFRGMGQLHHPYRTRQGLALHTFCYDSRHGGTTGTAFAGDDNGGPGNGGPGAGAGGGGCPGAGHGRSSSGVGHGSGAAPGSLGGQQSGGAGGTAAAGRGSTGSSAFAGPTGSRNGGGGGGGRPSPSACSSPMGVLPWHLLGPAACGGRAAVRQPMLRQVWVAARCLRSLRHPRNSAAGGAPGTWRLGVLRRLPCRSVQIHARLLCATIYLL